MPQRAYRKFPNYDGDEAGEVSARIGGRLFHADWCNDAGTIRLCTPSGLAAAEARDPQWGPPETQARHLLHVLHGQVAARAAGRLRYPPGPDGWLDPARLP